MWALGSGRSPDLEDNVARLEEVVVQPHTGGGEALERRPGHQGDVGGEEVGEDLVVSLLPQSHLHGQTNPGAPPALHTDQVTTEQKWIENLLPGFIRPEPALHRFTSLTSLTTLRNRTPFNLYVVRLSAYLPQGSIPSRGDIIQSDFNVFRVYPVFSAVCYFLHEIFNPPGYFDNFLLLRTFKAQHA